MSYFRIFAIVLTLSMSQGCMQGRAKRGMVPVQPAGNTQGQSQTDKNGAEVPTSFTNQVTDPSAVAGQEISGDDIEGLDTDPKSGGIKIENGQGPKSSELVIKLDDGRVVLLEWNGSSDISEDANLKIR